MKNFAFIDESGSPNLSDQKFYVITAAICSDKDVNTVMHGIKQISANYCSGAPLKSSRTAGKIKRRKAILNDLAKLPLSYIACVNDKSLVDSNSGLQWRASMYKFSQRMIFKRLYQPQQSLQIIIDNFGTSDFMNSFESYLNKHFQPTLFSNKQVVYESPEKEIGLQAADFVGGSIFRYYENRDTEEVLDCIKSRLIGIRKWPRSFQKYITGDKDEIIDLKIQNHCISVAEHFIQTTNDEILKEVCLFLLYDESAIEQEFIFGDELLRQLKWQGIINDNRDKDWLRQKIIAPLRDAGVLIAACADGYKIPDCRDDIAKFVQFVEMKSYPYLGRLVKMRESLFLGTDQQYDLIEESSNLGEILQSMHPE